MDPDFWRQRWERNEIGFHEPEANPALVEHLGNLALPRGSRVFVPLCGKSLDVGWLLAHGYSVAGAELVELAVEQLFAELGFEPEVTETGKHRYFRADGLEVWVGDVFDLSSDLLGPVDAVYDRAALVALPTDFRPRYVEHLTEITGAAPQLLLTFDYDQRSMKGPPFAVDRDEVRRLYCARYDLLLLADTEVEGGLKGRCPARENVWRLLPTQVPST